jgi:ketosteroid isomerase-like protein
MSEAPAGGTTESAAVAIVRRATEAFNRRDVDAMLSEIDERVEIDWTLSMGPMAGLYSGHEGVRRLMAQFTLFDEAVTEPLSFAETGEQVIVANVTRFRGRDGISLRTRFALVYTVNHDRITSLTLYQDEASARAAVQGA